MVKIFMGVVFVIGGFSGYLVLRGTHSGKALAALGMLLIIWGVGQEIAAWGGRGRRSGMYDTPEPIPEPRMNAPEIEQWIARELGRMRKPDDLITQVCERAGLDWDAAKALIKRVQDSHSKAIHYGHRRLSVAIGVPVVVCGIALLVGTTYAFLNNTVVIRGTDIVHPYVYYGFVLGLLMTVGGLTGMLHVK